MMDTTSVAVSSAAKLWMRDRGVDTGGSFLRSPVTRRLPNNVDWRPLEKRQDSVKR